MLILSTVKNHGAGPGAFKNMNSDKHETKPKQASGHRTQWERRASSPWQLVLAVICLGVCGITHAQSTDQKNPPLELDVVNKRITLWGGQTDGQLLEQGDDIHHVKIVFRADENPRNDPEIGIMLTPDLPDDLTKVSMDVLCNFDTSLRIRLGDASGNPFIVKTPVMSGAWTHVEFVLDEKSGRSWPPLKPYKQLAILATTVGGANAKELEIKNVRLIPE